MNVKNHTNEYAKAYPNFDSTPKAVVAAIAYSLALRLAEDNPEVARGILMGEWEVLCKNDIVPQKPPKD